MDFRRLKSVPRLARNLVEILLDRRAAVTMTNLSIRSDQREIGLVRRLIWTRRTVVVAGAAKGADVAFAFDGRKPLEVSGESFRVDLLRPEKSTPLTLTVQYQGEMASLCLTPPGIVRELLARLGAFPKVAADIVLEVPAIFRFLVRRDPSSVTYLRQRFELTDSVASFPVPRDLFGATTPRFPKDPPIIVLPIFDAFDDVSQLLDHLPGSLEMDHRLVLVNDGSSDPRIGERVRAFQMAHPNRTQVIQFNQNQGFVAATNAGLRAAAAVSNGHAVLLNSDTTLPKGWLSRLLAPILDDPTVASVTPLSNTAEILSVPGQGLVEMPEASMVAAMDSVASGFSPVRSTVDIPTGIGFCMAMNRTFLDRIGAFDPTFGRGYGEEVDWCQKARAAGGRHVAATNLFVGHRGGASFGSTEKTARIEAAGRIISARYPSYDSDVQAWCRSAPIAAQRLAVSIAWLAQASTAPVPIFLGHSLGGGAEAALAGEVSELLAAGAPGAIVLRVGGRAAWQVELIGAGGQQVGEVADPELLFRLLKPIETRKVVYSCGVGATSPLELPQVLLALCTKDARLEIRLHDFFPISPSWNLLGSDHRYTGPPPLDTKDPVHGIQGSFGSKPVTHRAWREAWGKAVTRADQITAYSVSSAAIFQAAYPLAEGKMHVAPHRLRNLPGILRPGGKTIGVLGGINRAKGADVITRLARSGSNSRIVVIGEVDGAFRLSHPNLVHGRYEPSQIAELAEYYDVGLWLVPSICPETFSFATHEALATGLPVVSFDLGAQADALSEAANGLVFRGNPEDIAGLSAHINELMHT